MKDWLEELQKEMYQVLCKELEGYNADITDFDIEHKLIAIEVAACHTQAVSEAVSRVIRLYYAKKKTFVGFDVFGGVSDIIDWEEN